MQRNEEAAKGRGVTLTGEHLQVAFVAVVKALEKSEKDRLELFGVWSESSARRDELVDENESLREELVKWKLDDGKTRYNYCCPQCSSTRYMCGEGDVLKPIRECAGCHCVYNVDERDAHGNPTTVREGTHVWIDSAELCELNRIKARADEPVYENPCPSCGNPHEEGGGVGGVYCHTCHASREDREEVIDDLQATLDEAERARDFFKTDAAKYECKFAEAMPAVRKVLDVARKQVEESQPGPWQWVVDTCNDARKRVEAIGEGGEEGGGLQWQLAEALKGLKRLGFLEQLAEKCGKVSIVAREGGFGIDNQIGACLVLYRDAKTLSAAIDLLAAQEEGDPIGA